MSETRSGRAIRSISVYTHRTPEVTREVVKALAELARRSGVELRFDRDETAKHGLAESGVDGLRTNSEDGRSADLCVVLGGDGTTLRALRAHAGTNVPVFSVNCGRVGFLATVDRDGAEEGLQRALAGDFEVIRQPSLVLGAGAGEFALNEVSFQRGAHMNVAHISFALAGEEVARAPCDGLIAATPMGSTGYNLSAGGPILAWDLKGFVVSMVAPHALSVRAVVAAPEDVLEVRNEGAEAVGVVMDGMPTGSLEPGASYEVRFRPDTVAVAQLPGSTFYSRFREKLRLLTGERGRPD
jgi:NAD+ kinase